MNLNCEKLHELAAKLTGGSSGAQCVQVMEICGTHTMAIARSGLRSMLGDNIRLTSGPGCPVCVTDQSYMDQAVMLSQMPDVVTATYGDMVRVPGREGSLADARARGAEIEIVYSADQAVETAKKRPDKQIVFLGVGFETTTPGTAMAVRRARDEGIENFSILGAHKMIVPAMRALLSAEQVNIDGFLCPGHVSVILGYKAYDEIVQAFAKPCVVAGFDASQVVLGLEEIFKQMLDGTANGCSVYSSVSAEGNAEAWKVICEVFQPCDAPWRAIGVIPDSGLALKDEFAAFDAEKRFDLPEFESYELPGCRCGDVICGKCSPVECGLFGDRCTPRDPVGPCMVSSEGACAASYKYERHDVGGNR